MRKTSHTCTLTLVLMCFTSPVAPVEAKPTANIVNIPNGSGGQFFQLPPFPDNGSPTGRPSRGAASRGRSLPESCASKQLTALVPIVEQSLDKQRANATYVWGKTVADRPTFWVYVPYTRKSLRSAEFVLQDEEDNDLYRTTVTLNAIPGVASLWLPSTLKPLKVGQMYHWFLKTRANCGPQQESEFEDYVEGWVQRVVPSPTLQQQLEAALPQHRGAIYAANGIWYEALTTLATLHSVEPKDATVTANWSKLLQSAGLGNIVSEPIVPCCSPSAFNRMNDMR